MAPASPSALLAVSDRPLPERAEPKGTDGSDGQFAGLMAHFAQPPTPPRAPDPPPSGPSRVDQESRTQAPEDRDLATAPASTAPARPEARSDSTQAKGEPSAPKTEAAKPKPEGEKPQAEAPKAEVPNPGATPAAGKAQTPGIPTFTPAVAPQAAHPALPDQAAPNQAGAHPASSHAALIREGDTLKIEAGEARPFHPKTTPEPKAPGLPTESATLGLKVPSPTLSKAELAANLKLQAPPTANLQPSSKVAAPVDPVRSASQGATQAVLAESIAKPKEMPKFEGPVAPRESPKTEAIRTEKLAKAIEAPSATKPSIQSLTKTPQASTPTAMEREATTGSAKSSASAPTDQETVLPGLDALAPQPANSAILQGPDGSALAALGSMPKATATAPVVAPPPAPPAPATPPTAPVVQVEGGFRWMLKGGAQEAQLQLHPESLGQVTIHLKVEGGEVHASLWITEPASVQAVQEGRPHLEQSLKEQGLQLGSFDLHQGHRPFQEAPSAPTYREPSAPETLVARQEAPAAPTPSILNPHRVELYA